MRLPKLSLILLALAGGTPMLVSATPATAQEVASVADVAAASAFIDKLADNAFSILREKAGNKASKLDKLDGVLRANFALDDIGNRLIRRYRTQITPAQLTNYQAVFPQFVTNVYTARLFDYSSADVKVVRAQPRGTRGDVDVFTRIQTQGGANPIEAIWAVRKSPAGKQEVTNLTVSGVNVALTQEADFSAYIQKNGFDALIGFMKSANAKNGINAAGK